MLMMSFSYFSGSFFHEATNRPPGRFLDEAIWGGAISTLPEIYNQAIFKQVPDLLNSIWLPGQEMVSQPFSSIGIRSRG
jgi:hypothetical protein